MYFINFDVSAVPVFCFKHIIEFYVSYNGCYM